MKLSRLLAIVAACLFGAVSSVSAQGFDAVNPATGHLYRMVLSPQRAWEQARLEAEASILQGVAGHLATITSAEEQAFIASSFAGLLAVQEVWIGGFQLTGSIEPAGGWQWVTGEPFFYSNWLPAEPNNNGNENRLSLLSAAWNDQSDLDSFGSPNRRAYLIEFAIPEPSAFAPAATSLFALSAIRRRQSIAR
jgi:hypothetical protein